jgi:hydroxymethylglutaryl-CoA lyase
MSGYPKLLLTEEGMRDGMQIESADIPVRDKIDLLDKLSETGLKEIAVGSFVSPKWTPQMACIEELLRGFHPKEGVRYVATILNDFGLQRAREFMPPLSERNKEYETQVYMCDVFSQRNTNRTQQQQVERWPLLIERARDKGVTEGGIGISAAWGSNWTGDITQEQRMLMLDRQHQLWDEAGIPVRRISFSDPMGWNMPDQVERQLEAVKERWPEINDFNLHLHNTRGTALASAYAAFRVLGSDDTVRLQSSIGGMGGCPFCGNGRAAQLVASEDLIHMVEEMGVNTGVDLYKLVECVWMAEEVVGHPLYGHVSKAGPRPRGKKLYPMDMPFVETLEQAKHFIKGPAAYAGSPSPWTKAIRSEQRPDSMLPEAKQPKPQPELASV